MNSIKYQYARKENDEIVHINDIFPEERHLYKYHCIGCGAEMVPRLGKINTHHFAHRSDQLSCSSESYLHKLAKILIKKKFDLGIPFEIKIKQTIECSDATVCVFHDRLCCKQENERLFDLRELYDTCSAETEVDGFIADLLLTNSRNPDRAPVLIEIMVTHKCSEQKMASGYRIIEIPIKDEKDIKDILEMPLTDQECHIFEEGNIKCTFYGFSKKSNISKRLECNNNIHRFVLHPNGAAHVNYRIPCNYTKPDRPKSILELNILDYNYMGNDSVYEKGYAKAIDLGYNVKTCQFCFHRKNPLFPSKSHVHFCCLFKKVGTPQYPKSNEAIKCMYYNENTELLKKALASSRETPIIVIKNGNDDK